MRSAEQLPADGSQTDLPPHGWSARLIEWTAAHPRLPLLAALALALLARSLLVLRSNALLDGDEALVGIQAQHILRGELPTYFYGQPYMGSLEAYLAAGIFRVFGPSAWALRAVPLLLALLLVSLTWRLARALLPAEARTTPLLAGLAALFAAAPPLYDAVTQLRTWGGQIEVYVVTVALLLATVELADRTRAGAGAWEMARRWAIWGFLTGLGIWINPLISYAIAACVLWLLLPALRRGVLRLRGTAVGERGTWRVVPLLAIVPGLALGGLPAWLYAARHSAENLLVYVSQPQVDPTVSGAARYGRVVLGAAITARYTTCVAPRVLNGALPTEPLAMLPLRLLLLLPPLVGLGAALWMVRHRLARPLRVGLPLLYAGVVSAVFSLGTSAWPATKPCEWDLAGRYAAPLALVEPFLVLALFALPGLLSGLRQWRGRPALGTAARQHLWSLALAAVVVAGVLQLGTYATADATAMFQSPFYPHIARDRSDLYAYLRAQNIRYAWANHWLGNIVTFETNGQTVCADYYDQVYKGGIERPPGTVQAVAAARAPSYILVRTDPQPELARLLDARGIPYTLAVLPRAGVTVITPAQTVDPATVVQALGVDYAR